MTLSLSFHDNFSFNEPASLISATSGGLVQTTNGNSEIHLCSAKLQIPKIDEHISRPRLAELLQKSTSQIGATLITGRAGTGKTALAAEFAKNYENVAWYSVEATDSDWETFSRYLIASFVQIGVVVDKTSKDVVPLVENLSAQVIEQQKKQSSTLLVLDDIHHVFDAEWFSEFFTTMLYLFAPHIHLLLLSRSSPAVPLWRLRSKQVLGVVDEKLLIFNEAETIELFERNGKSKKTAHLARKKSYGRISKLREMLEETTV